ncbi:MAG: RNase adapter RapZ [Clostridia bacterium]|nr:RNase adapter RapZ [Clostridiales bacterium]MDO4352440.1 RNase adapter RapZ [Clostridia bacterium]MEE0180613.1 RNase adapter RapZ [Anaerovoracaceae bacterium]
MELIIVTGLSGAGKSNALNCLEDMGYYCIDNMPPALIGSFIDLAKTNKLNVDKAAICIDSRSGEGYRGFDQQLNKYHDTDYKIMFLEASDETLIRRFNETRRNHPLNVSSVKDGIRKERAFLAKARSISNYVIDTSNMKTAKLKEVIKDIVMKGEEKQTFIINIQSFGYKHGMPLDADMVFDMRFIPNPYYVPSLKELTGNSMKVKNYVLRQQVTVEFMEKIVPLLEEIIPAYMQEGKYHLNIACGCTGGHHRSVASANELARIFREKGYRITLAHRDL